MDRGVKLPKVRVTLVSGKTFIVQSSGMTKPEQCYSLQLFVN